MYLQQETCSHVHINATLIACEFKSKFIDHLSDNISKFADYCRTQLDEIGSEVTETSKTPKTTRRSNFLAKDS